MKIASPKLITFLAGTALVGLCVIQYYWIRGAVDQKHEHFGQDVREALMQVSRKYNRDQAGARMRQLSYRRQSYVSNPYLNQPGNVHVFEEFYSDSAGHSHRSTRTKTYPGDTISREFNSNISANNIAAFSLRPSSPGASATDMNSPGTMMNGIFDEIVHINVYNDFSNYIDTILVDSLLKTELMNRGINTHYVWAILNTPVSYFNSNQKFNDAFKDSVLTSRYRVSLTADNLFAQPRMLSIYFPNESGYIIRSMWLMLILSAFFILLIIFLFYYSISTILRQKQLSEIKNDFISNMTHELKTPISTISLACEVLGDEDITKTKERTGRYLSMIKDENKRLGILVENVLQTALLDKGNFKLKPSDIDIHEIITQAIGSVQLAIDKKEGEIYSELKATKFEIYADRTHVQNVIYNLLDNAIKYTPGKPLIKISTKDLGSEIEICFKDNGLGISRENQKKIFEKLYRVPTGNVHDVKGFGLGLSYVKAIVEKHGGEIFVESELGHGSVFHVRLPYVLNEKPIS